MKLVSNRRKNQVHMDDLIRLGLVNASWLSKLPPALAERLKHISRTRRTGEERPTPLTAQQRHFADRLPRARKPRDAGSTAYASAFGSSRSAYSASDSTTTSGR